MQHYERLNLVAECKWLVPAIGWPPFLPESFHYVIYYAIHDRPIGRAAARNLKVINVSLQYEKRRFLAVVSKTVATRNFASKISFLNHPPRPLYKHSLTCSLLKSHSEISFIHLFTALPISSVVLPAK